MEEKRLSDMRYNEAVRVIKDAILQSQYQAARLVNKEQLALYYGIGCYISRNSRNGFGVRVPFHLLVAGYSRSCPDLGDFRSAI